MVRHDARIIAIGDELLCGRTIDTNSHRLQQRLARLGVTVRGVQVVADRADEIAEALDRVPADSLILLTGGLGPTADDLTVQTVCDWAGDEMIVDVDIDVHLRRRSLERGWPFGPNMVKQTLRPSGLTARVNPAGTAPALIGRLKDRYLVVLPGVPAEIDALWPAVEETLRDMAIVSAVTPFLLRRTVELSEPELSRRTEHLQTQYPELDWSWWMTRWGVDVQATAGREAVDPSRLDEVARALDEALAGHAFTSRYEDLSAVIIDSARTAGLTLGTAESCTGGLISAALTDPPGSSAVFKGSVVSYANTVKISALQVPSDVLEAEGAVSAAVAEAMARGARRVLDVDLTVAVTGIAGPDGGTPEKPVGTTWIAWADGDGVSSQAFRFRTQRHRNRELAVAAAMAGLWRRIAGVGVPGA